MVDLVKQIRYVVLIRQSVILIEDVEDFERALSTHLCTVHAFVIEPDNCQSNQENQIPKLSDANARVSHLGHLWCHCSG